MRISCTAPHCCPWYIPVVLDTGYVLIDSFDSKLKWLGGDEHTPLTIMHDDDDDDAMLQKNIKL
jgi:hypothetical protein